MCVCVCMSPHQCFTTAVCLLHLLSQMLMKTGCEGKPTVFLFSDNQIKDESFVEDINVILNTADVPNLYAAEEKADIIEKMQTVARTTVRQWRGRITIALVFIHIQSPNKTPMLGEQCTLCTHWLPFIVV